MNTEPSSLSSPALSAGLPDTFRVLPDLDEVWRATSAGERLDLVRRHAPRLRERVLESGQVACVRTFDMSELPYPTSFGLAGAASSPLPYLIMTNRAQLVQFESSDGKRKILLFNPTDVPRSAETPYFADLRKKMGDRLSRFVQERLRLPTAAEQITRAGVRPDEVDFIAFDHLHTQDLRGLLGTTGEGSSKGVFPRAQLLIWRPELSIFRALHPLQRPWYIAEALSGVPSERVLPVDGDLLLGQGVALVRTPGHTVGNWSLVVNTETGIWAVSENGIACDAYAPEMSAIPGVRRFAAQNGVEVILNSNTLEGRNEQYTSMVLEKCLVDRSPQNPSFYQHFASSELTAKAFLPGLKPTYHHGKITSGALRPF
ncbi:MAG: hypothetical protein ABI193_12045 [Minicystis sp.]